MAVIAAWVRAGARSRTRGPPTVDLRAFDRTYCWALDQTLDLHGNRVDYEYILGTGVLYPSRITWSHLATGGRTNYHEALFRYEDRPDVFDDYRPTFSARIDKRLQGIEVRSFYDGQSHLVRAYQLDYSRPADEPGIDLGISLLRQFTQFDRSGGTNNYLPPLRFGYSPFALSLKQVARVSPLPGLDLLDGESVQIADMNGDGLPDLVASGGGIANPQRVAWNVGADPATGLIRFDPPTNVVNSSSIKLTNAESTLADMDGDGLVDYAQLVTDGLTGKRLLIHRNRQRLDRPGPRLAGFFDPPLPGFGGGPREISFTTCMSARWM